MALSGAAGFLRHEFPLPTGVELHVQERPGKGTPVILLHGIWGSWRSWLPLIDLPLDPFGGRPLWAIDLRGHGASSKPPAGYALNDYAADILALVDLRGAERVILYGHSVGALTGLAAARAIPNRVEGLILEEPPLPIPKKVRSLDGFWASFAEAVVGLLFLKHQPMEVMVRELLDRDPELAQAEAEDAAVSIAGTADGVFTALINGDFQANGLTCGDALQSIPALILQGALLDQRALSVEGVSQLQTILPLSRVIVLPDTGHSIHQADPEGTNQAVRAFLEHLPFTPGEL